MKVTMFNSYMSVAVNESPTYNFKVDKGLRQGGPVSPFPFVIQTKGLKCLINKGGKMGIMRVSTLDKVALSMLSYLQMTPFW